MIKLTVIYESPFWVGIFERQTPGEYAVARTIFGQEPRDTEVLEFVMQSMDKLRFSSPQAATSTLKKVNPKRLQREVKKDMANKKPVSKAQEALRLELEKNKKQKRSDNSKRKKAQQQAMFELKQRQKKEKRRGH